MLAAAFLVVLYRCIFYILYANGSMQTNTVAAIVLVESPRYCLLLKHSTSPSSSFSFSSSSSTPLGIRIAIITLVTIIILIVLIVNLIIISFITLPHHHPHTRHYPITSVVDL